MCNEVPEMKYSKQLPDIRGAPSIPEIKLPERLERFSKRT